MARAAAVTGRDEPIAEEDQECCPSARGDSPHKRGAAGLAALDACLSSQAKSADRTNTIIRRLTNNEYPFLQQWLGCDSECLRGGVSPALKAPRRGSSQAR
jgi:hypothetical protein